MTREDYHKNSKVKNNIMIYLNKNNSERQLSRQEKRDIVQALMSQMTPPDSLFED